MEAIAAVATPPGRGGVAVIRVSGDGAAEILKKIFVPANSRPDDFEPWRLRRGFVKNGLGELLDETLCVFMPGPKTFTGEDVAEIHCHGNPAVTDSILEAVFAAGARAATRGEFSKRAFLNGRIDLIQAEAVAELIAAPTRKAADYGLRRLCGALGEKIANTREDINQLRALACVGIDFPDDEVPPLSEKDFYDGAKNILASLRDLNKNARRASLMESGAKVLLAGPVNAGKSSLLNALCGRDRALVTDTPGTTRDFIEATLDLDGLAVTFIDSAGLRSETEITDAAEKMGVARSRELVGEADLTLLVIDCVALARTKKLDASVREIIAAAKDKPLIIVFNKTDAAGPPDNSPELSSFPTTRVSALNGTGLEELLAVTRRTLTGDRAAESGELAPNRRQALSLDAASTELELLLADISAGATYDCLVGRLDAAAAALEEIMGLEPSDALLERIFSQFCIGK